MPIEGADGGPRIEESVGGLLMGDRGNLAQRRKSADRLY